MTAKNEFNINLDPIPTSTKESLFNPTAVALGKGLGGVASFISIPFQGLGLWSENVIDNFQDKILNKNQSIPEKNRDFSKFQQTAKAIHDAKFSLGEEELQELFATLISNTLDDRVNHKIHPSFSTILKEFTTYDAQIFEKIYHSNVVPIATIFVFEKETFSGQDFAKNTVLFNDVQIEIPVQLNSLDRLGLIKILPVRHLLMPTYQNKYDNFENSLYYKNLKESLPLITNDIEFTEIELKRGHIALTDLGKLFGDVVLNS